MSTVCNHFSASGVGLTAFFQCKSYNRKAIDAYAAAETDGCFVGLFRLAPGQICGEYRLVTGKSFQVLAYLNDFLSIAPIYLLLHSGKL